MGHPSTDSASASSSNKELQRKELMQCQYCFRSRLSGGAILSRCSGCQIAWYCSRECQMKHWPYHKKLCKVNRHILSMPPAHAERMKQLRAFTTKHRPTLVQLGRLALDLHRHPENWVKKVLLVVVRPRSNIESRKAEKAFEVLDLLVKDPSYWGDNEESIHVQFRYMQDLQARVGGFGGYTVVIQDQDTTLQNIVGVGFTEDLTDEDFTEDTWKEAMLHRMNNGIVL